MRKFSILVLLEELINENPNQAIKFLKNKGIDPNTSDDGKRLYDQILTITGGDGFTYLLTKFSVDDKLTIDEIRRLHDILKSQKVLLTKLPKPVVNYETYRELFNDITTLKNNISINWLLKQLSPELRQYGENLSTNEKIELRKVSEDFRGLKPEKQRFFMSKAFGYKDFSIFLDNIKKYIKEVHSEQDYETTKSKILTTDGAYLVYDSPEKNILIAHIDSFDAMKTLGCTSAWCISRDMVRYKQYKSGGNQYFMIWDYNYPIDNLNFFIATAYNYKNPGLSATHEHINDGRLNLIDVLDSKKINKDVFDNYIIKFKENLRKTYKDENILVRSLREGKGNDIVEILNNSDYLQKYNANPSYDRRWGNDQIIDIGIKKSELFELLDLGYDVDSVIYVSKYGDTPDNYDSSEADYMHGGLNEDNIERIKELAQKIGILPERYENFGTKEGDINAFLTDYGFENLIETYIEKYNEAQSNATQKAAQEIIDKIPFNLDDISFSMSEMFDYYIENNLTAKNFDELIDQIKEKLPDVSLDSIYEARYRDLDLDELNTRFGESLESIIQDIDIDDENPYYMKAKAVQESLDYLKRLNFEIVQKSDLIARLETKTSTIIINEITTEEQADDTYKIIASVTLQMKKPKKFIKRVKIPLYSIQKYIDQLELFFEQYEKVKKLLN